MANPIQMIKLNNLQYNSNRDPQIFRRVVNEPFRLQVFLKGSGSAQVKATTPNKTIAEQTVSLPGIFDCEVSFDKAASHVGTITVEANGETVTEYVRFDVTETPWHI